MLTLSSRWAAIAAYVTPARRITVICSCWVDVTAVTGWLPSIRTTDFGGLIFQAPAARKPDGPRTPSHPYAPDTGRIRTGR
ncbi:MAG: hypothetical protein QP780_00060 [Brevibacterium sp. UMB1308B]|nr:hypothetical protein [Brevibacterium sp. UMB1308B]